MHNIACRLAGDEAEIFEKRAHCADVSTAERDVQHAIRSNYRLWTNEFLKRDLRHFAPQAILLDIKTTLILKLHTRKVNISNRQYCASHCHAQVQHVHDGEPTGLAQVTPDRDSAGREFRSSRRRGTANSGRSGPGQESLFVGGPG